jgi:acyl-coenzyme A thioesterase PaaI-like protein
VTGNFKVTDHHQGAPGLAHGGVLTTAMDEVLGSLNWLLAAPAVTGRLSCEFRRPVPVGSMLFIAAEVTGTSGRRVFGSAVARLDSPTGQVAVSAESVFVQVPMDHFLTNGAQAQVEQALHDRANGGPSWRPGARMEINP